MSIWSRLHWPEFNPTECLSVGCCWVSFKGWGDILPSEFSQCVVHWGVRCRHLNMAPGTLTLAQEGIQAWQWQCCSGGISCTEQLCPRSGSSSGGGGGHRSAPQGRAADSWSPTGCWDLSPHTVARHLGKPSPKRSCMSVTLLIILSQALSLCLEVRNAFHLQS